MPKDPPEKVRANIEKLSKALRAAKREKDAAQRSRQIDALHEQAYLALKPYGYSRDLASSELDAQS